MLELLQFSLLDMTPYDQQSWLNLIATYNHAIWPIQLLAGTLSIVIPLLLWQSHQSYLLGKFSCQLALIILALGWFWCGGIFHWQYFSSLNWAASFFAIAFILQGFLLLCTALLIHKLSWITLPSFRGCLGLAIIFMGLLFYPLTGLLQERNIWQLEWFPLMPAPITLTTIGCLILLGHRLRHGLIIIPLLWSVISAAFASTLGLPAFYFLIGALLLWCGHYGLLLQQNKSENQ